MIPTTPQTFKKNINKRLKKWLRPPRRLSFTTSGWLFVLMTLGVGFGAINTGNNLLFLLLGMMLSLIVASGILSEAVLRSITAQRLAPRRLHVGQKTPAHLELTNSGRWSSLSIEVSEQNPTCTSGPLRGQFIGPTYFPWWKFWKRQKSAPKNTPQQHQKHIAIAYCLQIPGGDKIALPTHYTLPARGLFDFPGLNLTTRFPFGFFEKTREIDTPLTLAVYPRPAPAIDWITSLHEAFGELDSPNKGLGEGFFGLREYRPGEDRRRVHWKSSARRGQLVVRENESHEQRAIEIFLINATGHPPAKRHLFIRDFESGLEKTTGLLLDMHRRGYQIALRTLEQAIPAAHSESHLEHLLYILATIDLKDDAPTPIPSQNTTATHRITLGLAAALAQSPAAQNSTPNTSNTPNTSTLLIFDPPPQDAP